MEAPKQTALIFEILSKGQFICSNSSEDIIRKLYNILENEESFEFLYNYFLYINFILEKGNEYFYFSRKETKVDLERKIEQAFKWIDILDFFKTYDNSFSAGYRFSPSDILVKTKVDAELKTKLESLKKYSSGRENHSEIVERILDSLEKDKFIEVENANINQYKVLTSFQYLEQLVMTIHIPEETTHEISE